MGPPPRNQNFVGGEIIKLGFKDFPLKEMDKVLEAGIDDLRFCKLIEWMCNEISTLYGLDETVHAPTGSENMEFFLLELSSLLAELECPVDALTSGSPLDRFRPMESRMKLLNFLIGHLKCARLTALDRLQNETTIHKSDEVCLLEKAMSALGINQVSAETAAGKLFATLQNLAEKQMAKCKEKPNPLLTASLTEAQWAKVAALNEKLIQEYRSRILLLLKRLDVTIESFTWSDRIKKMQDKLHEIYRPRRDNILVASNVTMSDLLAATTSLLMVDKVDSEKERKRTATRLNKVLMTDRPGDRGGRPSELRAPPPEMPSWMKDRAPDMGRQRGGYQGGGGGGYGNYQGGGGGYGNYQGGGGDGGYGNYQSGGGGYGNYQGGGGGYGNYQSGGGGYGSYQGGGGGYGGYHGGGGFRGGGRGGGFENQVMREYEGRRFQDSGRGGGRGRGGGYGNQRAYR